MLCDVVGDGWGNKDFGSFCCVELEVLGFSVGLKLVESVKSLIWSTKLLDKVVKSKLRREVVSSSRSKVFAVERSRKSSTFKAVVGFGSVRVINDVVTVFSVTSKFSTVDELSVDVTEEKSSELIVVAIGGASVDVNELSTVVVSYSGR